MPIQLGQVQLAQEIAATTLVAVVAVFIPHKLLLELVELVAVETDVSQIYQLILLVMLILVVELVQVVMVIALQVAQAL
jgi:hypothetical protein